VIPLVIAARTGDAATVDALVRAGADVNASTPHSGTPLMAAAENGHVEVIERLVAAGADVRARDRIIQTALYAAAQRRHEGAVRALLAAKADPNDGSLAVAALRGDPAVVTLLLDHGADLGRHGAHALYEATRAGADEVVVLLLERGRGCPRPPGREEHAASPRGVELRTRGRARLARARRRSERARGERLHPAPPRRLIGEGRERASVDRGARRRQRTRR
jgi:hypothetical protein